MKPCYYSWANETFSLTLQIIFRWMHKKMCSHLKMTFTFQSPENGNMQPQGNCTKVNTAQHELLSQSLNGKFVCVSEGRWNDTLFLPKGGRNSWEGEKARGWCVCVFVCVEGILQHRHEISVRDDGFGWPVFNTSLSSVPNHHSTYREAQTWLVHLSLLSPA